MTICRGRQGPCEDLSSGPKWKKAHIESRTSPLSYTVKYEDGVVARRHVDHLLERHDVPSREDDVLPDSSVHAEQNPGPSTAEKEQENMATEEVSTNTGESTTTTTTTIFIRAQKLYSVNINTRKKKLQRKRAQPLRNSKLIELSGWAKRKKICKYPKLTYNYGHILPFTQTRARTNNNRQGKCTRKNWKILLKRCCVYQLRLQNGKLF